MIVDPTDTTITFVKTSLVTSPNFNPATGLLTATSYPATYTVTLQSASNGFTDLAGDLLNGAAGNYVATFVVNAPPVAVGIPSFARGPDSVDAINVPAGAMAVGIPVNLSSGSGVTSGKFTLQYNSALLSVSGITVNSALAGASLALDAASTPGTAIIDFSSATALASGVVRLGGLVATVPNSASAFYGSAALLHWSGVQLNGGAIAVTGDDAVQVVDYLGDTNADGNLSGGDAAQIADLNGGTNAAAGQLGGFSGFPLVTPSIIGDVNNNGNADSADVTLLNSVLSGTPHPQVPTIPNPVMVAPTGAAAHLSIPTNLTVTPGGTVVVPVNIDNPDPLGSGGLAGINLAIDFDPTVFTVSAVSAGTLTAAPGWAPPAVNIGTTGSPAVPNGQIGIAFANGTPITTTTGGSLVLITFQANANAAGGASAINLAATNAPYSITVTTRLDSLTTKFLLAPAPTNAANDAGVDGSVTVEIPGVTVSMPTDLTASPASTVTVPVDISSLDDPVLGDQGTAGASVVIDYNPAVFTVAASDVNIGTISTSGSTTTGNGFSPTSPNGWSTTTNASNVGVLIISLSNDGQGVVTGKGTGSLVNVNFHIKATAPHGKTILDLAADAGVIANATTELVDDSFSNYVLNPEPLSVGAITPNVAERRQPD